MFHRRNSVISKRLGGVSGDPERREFPVPPGPGSTDASPMGVYSGRVSLFRGDTVRFPLRRQQAEDTERQPQAASPAEPLPFVAPSVARSAPADEGGIPDDLFKAEPAPAPLTMPLKGQFTAADSRADRLVRQIRGEVEALKRTLDTLALEQDEMVEVDAASVAANPEAAASLPPAVLVRTILSSEAANRHLRKRVTKQGRREAGLRRRLNELKIESAGMRARLETLEEVLGALSGNLQDLRLERDYQRGAGVAIPAPALRPAPTPYPLAANPGGEE